MALKTLPPRALLRELLDYDVTTGNFIWRHRPRDMFRNEQNFRLWNTRYAGKIAGGTRGGKQPYLYIAVHHTQYFAHRLVWLYVHGDPVPNVIDHIDGNPLNNRFSNLRACSKAQNCANQRLRDSNTTGVRGVVRRNGRFQAQIMVNFKTHYLGRFDTLEEAAKARYDAAIRLYGAFAKH
jgi:hypothetical protein